MYVRAHYFVGTKNNRKGGRLCLPFERYALDDGSTGNGKLASGPLIQLCQNPHAVAVGFLCLSKHQASHTTKHKEGDMPFKRVNSRKQVNRKR